MFHLIIILFQEIESKEGSASASASLEQRTEKTQDVGISVQPVDIAESLLESSIVSDVSINPIPSVR